jgi:hypothetical protein
MYKLNDKKITLIPKNPFYNIQDKINTEIVALNDKSLMLVPRDSISTYNLTDEINTQLVKNIEIVESNNKSLMLISSDFIYDEKIDIQIVPVEKLLQLPLILKKKN